MRSRWSAGPASSSRREKLKSSSRRRRSRNRGRSWMKTNSSGPSPPAEEGRGRLLDRYRVAEPGRGRAGRLRPRDGSQPLAERGVASQVGRSVPLEDDRSPRQDGLPIAGELLDLLEVRLPPLVREP